MMVNWSILGIEPTTDAKIIKKAYAQKVKEIHQEDDPEGWQQLYSAYKAALLFASNSVVRSDTGTYTEKTVQKSNEHSYEAFVNENAEKVDKESVYQNAVVAMLEKKKDEYVQKFDQIEKGEQKFDDDFYEARLKKIGSTIWNSRKKDLFIQFLWDAESQGVCKQEKFWRLVKYFLMKHQFHGSNMKEVSDTLKSFFDIMSMQQVSRETYKQIEECIRVCNEKQEKKADIRAAVIIVIVILCVFTRIYHASNYARNTNYSKETQEAIQKIMADESFQKKLIDTNEAIQKMYEEPFGTVLPDMIAGNYFYDYLCEKYGSEIFRREDLKVERISRRDSMDTKDIHFGFRITCSFDEDFVGAIMYKDGDGDQKEFVYFDNLQAEEIENACYEGIKEKFLLEHVVIFDDFVEFSLFTEYDQALYSLKYDGENIQDYMKNENEIAKQVYTEYYNDMYRTPKTDRRIIVYYEDGGKNNFSDETVIEFEKEWNTRIYVRELPGGMCEKIERGEASLKDIPSSQIVFKY